MELAILQTLCYHDLFDYPLTLKEIHRFLIGSAKRKAQNLKLQLETQNLIKEGKIERKGSFYFLKGREKIVVIRKRREKYSQKKLLIAKKAARFLRLILTIKMVAVTGALAINNSQNDDDIDFLIVTQTDRLWLTRIQAVLLIELMGMRRRAQDVEVTDKLCLNIFLDENHLALPRNKRNLFTAHEIALMKLLWQRDNVYQKFLKENQWIKRFLPNWKN